MPTLEKAQSGEELEQSASAAAYQAGQSTGQGEGGGRFWSARRVPATLVGLVMLGCASLLLYDIAAVRADRPAMAWRRSLAEELATRRLDDIWVVLGAIVAVLLGVWLIVLALTPGLRGLLTMRGVPGTRAGLERATAALVLRDRATQVAGVRSVRVAVGRRRVRARAEAHFRELDAVRGDLDTALEDGIRQLGLGRPMGLTVQVRRPAKR
ncbi:DUF6286 domain-containing protein [Streptomyces gobiensis]|uniref:DUF6286 domain-containing protein n=1 Tax=Streptomyces gobiensis TaxID=2875706 RepID=UPI001E6071B5|nr:DUF6286 domain-containing protein [Streptomyces gobiensis]UGY94975.1 DUF6286 domain-containing protein [Streptomyces gobiensis]